MKKRLLSFALALVMCLSLLPPTVFAAGGGPVAINDANFPDANFLAYVKTLPGAKDGVFTEAELAAIQEIDCSGIFIPEDEQISDFTGIEHFTALTTLRCSGNALTKLYLSQNAALTTLNCDSCELTELDVSQNTALKDLSCVYNHLTSLDLSRNTELTELRCYSNQLTSLVFGKNSALTNLDCHENQLTDLELSNAVKLTNLICRDNRLTGLDVSKNTMLTNLYCHNNQLTSLVLGKNSALIDVDCDNNQLTSLDVSENSGLKWLDCDNNHRFVKNGTELAVMDANFDPAKVKRIVGGNFDGGKVNFTADELSYDYDCGNSKTVTFKLFNAAPQGILINETNFPDQHFLDYVNTLPGAENRAFIESEIAAITEIDCNGSGSFEKDRISDLTGIEHFTALNRLSCCDNKLTELDVSKNTALTGLSCYNNQLTSLKLGNTAKLTDLYSNNNRLTSLDVSRSTALSRLECAYNQLTELDVSQNTAMDLLYCNNNQLTSLDVSQNTELFLLNCDDNQLTSLDLSKNTKLTALGCNNNRRAVTQGTELAVMDPKLDPTKVSNIVGGSFDGGKVNFTADELTYDYDCGNGMTVNFKLVRTAPTFVDVKPGDWFYDGVQYTTARGLFKGISLTEFGPKIPMTRSMVVQVLYSMAGKPKVEKTNQFVDVKDSDWFANAVAWGVENGVTAGYPGGRFAPDDKVNREQLAVMLHGFMKKPAATEPLTFADTDKISGWARNAVQWAVEDHLMGGVPGNKILPQGLAERSQGAVIMMNFDQMPKQ